MWEQIWAVLNSPAGITAIAALVLWGLNKLYAAKPTWAKFEGAIISAIKWAEKKVPDDTENKGAAKLDQALKYVIKVYEETAKKRPSEKVVADLKEGIQITHDRLASAGRV